MGCYGYQRFTTPMIDRFSGIATLYSRSIASSPWTVPTHASYFTGKHSYEHGARTYLSDDKKRTMVNSLETSFMTLTEFLKSRGYTTAAYVANVGFLHPKYGINQGFDTYFYQWIHADKLNDEIFKWMDESSQQPFFLFINYIDTHYPLNLTSRPGLVEEPVVDDKGRLVTDLVQKVMMSRETVPEILVDRVFVQYDTAIANVDLNCGKLLQYIADKQLLENSLVLVTSDHGEYFGEHRYVGHPKDVYEEALWVPLMIKPPSEKSGRISDLTVSSVDIPHIICSHVAPEMSFNTIFTNKPGNHPVISENYYGRQGDYKNRLWGHRFKRIRTAMYEWPYKLIYSSDGKHELYNLSEDPKETRNIIREKSPIAKRMISTFEDYRSRLKPGRINSQTSPLSDSHRDQLKALGYIED